jgi:uncharacterized protein (DUF1501 family)
MDRRNFILRTSGAVSLPLLFNGLPMKAFDGPLLGDLFNTTEATDRVLVLIQLNGGNDGLNTVLPLDQYGALMQARANVAIPEAKALKLTDTIGLHPVMTGVRDLYTEKKVAIVHGAGYPNPNLSHFRSTDIWMTASASNQIITSGWLGRYMHSDYPGYPEGYPNETMPDPIAIQMSAVVSLALTGQDQHSLGIALQDPETFYQLVSGTTSGGGDLPTEKNARANVEYVREVQSKSLTYSNVIKGAADKATNQVTYPTANRVADQLKIVARLIAGGLKTRVYVVTLGGFDTHAGQVVEDDPTTGTHATLLQQLSDAVVAFQRDIEALKVDHRVVAMTFSEFGRRVASNLSLGTDHGTAAPMLFFGTPVEDGMRGSHPSVTDLDNGNLKMQIDFRAVYASVLQQWFGADEVVLREVLFQDFSTIPVIKTSPTSVSESATADGLRLLPVAPNPVRGHATIRFEVDRTAPVHLAVYDMMGFHVATLLNGDIDAGTHDTQFSADGLPSGTYMVQLRRGDVRVVQPIVVTR